MFCNVIIIALPPAYVDTPRARINQGQMEEKPMVCSAIVGVKADSGSVGQKNLCLLWP